MNIVMKTLMRLCICSLLFVGRVTSLSFCDYYCDCYTPDISCSGVDFKEALSHTIPDDVTSSTTSLEILYFDDVKLTLDNDTFLNFHALQRLTISYYAVTFLSEFVFEGLNDLFYIYLELNSMTDIPYTALSHVRTTLQELHLANQRITEIPANSFVELGNLRELTITYNYHVLDISADAFAGLTNLTHLYLSACSIRLLRDTTFIDLHHLQELDLSYNLLVKVPTAIHALRSLIKLDLSHNQLLDNPRNLIFLVGMPKLQTLQMGFCAISEISSDAVDNLNTSQELIVANFDGNPFNCTKDLCSFAIWYLLSLPEPSTSTRGPYFIPFITLSPPPGKGPYQCDSNSQSLQDFYNDSCLPAPDPNLVIVQDNTISWHMVVIAVSVILVAFVVALVSFVVWKFRLINHYHHRFGIHFQRRAYGAIGDNNHEYTFDAYVSHHEDDKPFVEDEMLPRLEDDNNFEVCVSFRNFRLGSNLLENVSSAQDVSRAIIFIVNDRFMQNGQCKLELEMASTRMLEDEMDHGGQRLIIILMEVLSPDLVNNTLRMLLNHVAYLDWDPAAEERCWGQLIATLRTMVPERNDDNEQGANDNEQGADDNEQGANDDRDHDGDEQNAGEEPGGNEHVHE